MSETGSVQIEACPACGGTNAPAIGEIAEGFDTVINDVHFYQPPYAVRGCATCGLHFKTVQLSPSVLATYYAALDGSTFEIDADFPTDRILRERLAALPPASRVLDFGCSTGRVLKDFTTTLACFGVEPNEPAAAIAQARGITILTPDQLATAAPFHAIVLADVFEHLEQPVELLKSLAGRLAPGGWLAIVTGNADAIEDRRHFSEFWYFRLPGHLIMLSRKHLGWLANRLGLELGDARECSHYTVPLAEQLRQRVQAFAYEQFRSSPSSAVTRMLGLVPRLSAARRWTTAPALNFRNDHVVAFFHSPNR